MKIAIDLRPLQIGHEFRGIGSYLNNILVRFPMDSEEHTFIFVRYDDSNPLEDLGIKPHHYDEVLIRAMPVGNDRKSQIHKSLRRMRTDFGKLQKHKPDVYFQPDFQLGLPRGKMKKVVVIYDLIPLVLINLYLPSWRKYLFQPGLGKRRRVGATLRAYLNSHIYKIGVKSIRRADDIISISKTTTDDMQTILNVPKRKIHTIPLAPDKIESTKKLGVPEFASKIKKPYLLFVGGTDQRRKLADLVHAFHLLNGRGHAFDLVLAGRDFGDDLKLLINNVEAKKMLQNSSYKDRLHILGYVSKQDKQWLYKNAFVFVYPTLYEGFGLPVLEAMANGCPVITYNNSSIPEISGKAAVLLDEYSGNEICKNILLLNGDTKRCNDMKRLGIKQSDKYSWEETASITVKITFGS